MSRIRSGDRNEVGEGVCAEAETVTDIARGFEFFIIIIDPRTKLDSGEG